MRKQNSSLTGTVATNPQTPSLTFPARLIHPPQSQITRTEDAVTDRIVKLDAYAQQLGQGFGMSFSSFVLNEIPDLDPPGGPTTGVGTLSLLAKGLLHREERVALDRKGGRWGLYFTREISLVGGQNQQRIDGIPLKDAPLDVRERFLIKSEAFFRAYLKLCEGRLAQMHDSVAHGDRTLALLNSIKFVE